MSDRWTDPAVQVCAVCSKTYTHASYAVLCLDAWGEPVGGQSYDPCCSHVCARKALGLIDFKALPKYDRLLS